MESFDIDLQSQKNNMRNKGTIAYIGGFELPDKNAAAHRVISNGKALEQLGYKVVFVGVTDDDKIINNKIVHYGFDTYATRVPRGLMEQVSYFYDVSHYKKIFDTLENLKGVICYNMPSGLMRNLRKYNSSRNVKTFADVTEWYLGSLKSNILMTLFKRNEYKIRMLYTAKKLDGVIAISSYLNTYFKEKNAATITIPPLVDSYDEKWGNIPSSADAPIKIVYAGGAFSIKEAYVKDRLDLVIEALSVLKREGFNFIFNVFGTSLEEFLVFYPNLIENVNTLDNSLFFHGKVSHKEALSLVRKSDFSIFIRDKSKVTMAGFPTKFVESITSGTIVLTNNNSNVQDFLTEGENGFLINISSLDAIIASLRVPLSMDKERLAIMKDKTFKSKLFDYRNYIKEFDKMF